MQSNPFKLRIPFQSSHKLRTTNSRFRPIRPRLMSINRSQLLKSVTSPFLRVTMRGKPQFPAKWMFELWTLSLYATIIQNKVQVTSWIYCRWKNFTVQERFSKESQTYMPNCIGASRNFHYHNIQNGHFSGHSMSSVELTNLDVKNSQSNWTHSREEISNKTVSFVFISIVFLFFITFIQFFYSKFCVDDQ